MMYFFNFIIIIIYMFTMKKWEKKQYLFIINIKTYKYKAVKTIPETSRMKQETQFYI